ncbi:MAG TPA: phosphatidate cytidylyltransferase [Rhodocyclaceae bacterium]|nr:phosphatidate cytidylyltransferase [Rhodocyclaceae bacterium]
MLKTRVITALCLAAGLLAALFLLPPAASSTLFAAVIALGAWEWAGLLRASGRARRRYALLTLAPCLSLYLFGMPAAVTGGLWFLALGFWLLLVPLWFSRRWALKADLNGFLLGWLLLVPSWAAMVTLQRRSPLLLLAAMSLVWVADIAAYFAGRAWGRRKLAPTISPGKTWEGAAGALVAVIIYGLLLGIATGRLNKPRQFAVAAAALALATAVSIVGDLFESLAKRQAGVKDSSALLPGHGGVLDRIDSLTSTLPLVALAAVCLA